MKTNQQIDDDKTHDGGIKMKMNINRFEMDVYKKNSIYILLYN